MLDAGGAAVGAVLLIFSNVRVGDTATIRCNVSSWFVAPEFRSFGSLFVSKALSRKNVTYFNVTPAPHTLPLVRAQGYSQYNKGVFVAAPALSRGSDAARATVAIARAGDRSAAAIEASEHELLLDHAGYGCTSVLCTAADGVHPFVFRPRVFKGIIPCVQLVYCRAVDDFVRLSGPIGRFLAMRGRPLVVIDGNGPVAGLTGKYFEGKMPKYFKGPDQPRFGDLAYTETAMFGV